VTDVTDVTGLPDWHGRGQSIDLESGGSLYFELEGEGPPVLVVGGGPGADHTHYHPWFSTLAAQHTVVYYDHPGTGRSEAGDGATYTLETYAEAIEALRDHLGLADVSVVGLSFGGLPAVAYALRHPDRVRSLVLSNAHVDARGWQEGNIDHLNQTLRLHFPETWVQILALRERGVLSLDDTYQELVARALPRLEWAHPDTRPSLESDRPFTLAAYETFVGSDPEWVVGGALRGYDPELEEIGAPTLVVCGRWDGLTLPSIAAECANRIAHSRWHVFEESAHRPWAEQPAEYFEVVEEFFGSLTS
jgi:proline iminopeptidase